MMVACSRGRESGDRPGREPAATAEIEPLKPEQIMKSAHVLQSGARGKVEVPERSELFEAVHIFQRGAMNQTEAFQRGEIFQRVHILQFGTFGDVDFLDSEAAKGRNERAESGIGRAPEPACEPRARLSKFRD
jgi:hypothetical protein